MPQIINTNIASLTAQRNLNVSQNALDIALQRLSSGLRINSAKDDAAGLAISERFTAQINGLTQASRNANDGISLAQTAGGALGTADSMLQRIRQLAVQSANATNSASDRQAIQAEVGQLTAELDRTAQTTAFNGKNLLDGTFGTAQFQVGANANQTIQATMANFRTNQYGDYRITGQATTAVAGTASGITLASNLTVSGAIGSANVAVAIGESAKAIATGVNAVTGSTGVTAAAKTTVNVTFGAAGAYKLAVVSDNGTAASVSISFNLSAATTADGLSAAVSAFNSQTSKTGVTAQVDVAGTGITLTNATGNNIEITNSATDAGATTVGTAAALVTGTSTSATVTGQVTFDASKAYSVTTTAASLGVLSAASASATLKAVSTLDVSTVAGANLALFIVDAALSTVNGERAQLGALQNRFQSTISNLSITTENLTAARSRIRDADFAKQTAAMTRDQILQQAGTAVLRQANALPRNVLTLLR